LTGVSTLSFTVANLSEGTVKVTVHRLRQRFRDLLRAEVANTVARPEDIDGELRHLISVLK
jgi:RNA polymerase sigma-70 factor (ECF subfamily)